MAPFDEALSTRRILSVRAIGAAELIGEVVLAPAGGIDYVRQNL